MDLGGDSYTSHFYATFDVFMLIFHHFEGYQAVGHVVNGRLMQVWRLYVQRVVDSDQKFVRHRFVPTWDDSYLTFCTEREVNLKQHYQCILCLEAVINRKVSLDSFK